MKEKITTPLAGLKDCFVAGGTITSLHTNRPINDYDIYPKTELGRDNAIHWAYDNGWWPVHVSKRALTFVESKGDKESMHLQIMLFDTFETAEKIFEAFDFTVCMGAFDLDTEKFILHNQFLLHCSQRFLSFNRNTRFPYASAWRVRKYEERGYTIGKMEFHKILMACAERPIRSWDDLREQIGGIYGEAIEIPEGLDFSIEAAHDAISSMKPGKPMEGYPSAEEAVACTSTREIRYVKLDNGSIYANLWGDGDFIPITNLPLNGKQITVPEMFPSGTFYKKAARNGDVFNPPHRPAFTYRIGEIAESGAPHLFVLPTPQAAKNYSAYGQKEWFVLELKAEPEDIVFEGHQIVLKKAMVVAAHALDSIETPPIEEMEHPF